MCWMTMYGIKISDASVSIITEAELLGVEAYLCFYEADNVLPDNEPAAPSAVELGICGCEVLLIAADT